MKIRRKRKPTPKLEDNGQAALALDDFLTPPPKAPRSRKKSSYDLALISARVCADSGEWADAKPRVFVGLYIMCHELIYGIRPDELKPDGEMRKVSRLAQRCLKNNFDGNGDDMASFVKWTWERQKKKEAWAMSQGRNLNRLSVWIQFSAGLVTDYRKAMIDRARLWRDRRG